MTFNNRSVSICEPIILKFNRRESDVDFLSPPVPGSDCSPYYYPPVGEALSQFPAGWTTATILPGDVKAQAKWAKIQPMIPTGIAVKVCIVSESFINIQIDKAHSRIQLPTPLEIRIAGGHAQRVPRPSIQGFLKISKGFLR